MIDFMLSDDVTAFSPGQAITGTIRWSGDTAPAWLELRLFWYTEGKGTQDIGVAGRERLDAPGTAGERAFRLVAPEHPLSCSGRLVSIRWALELVSADHQPVIKRDLVIGPGAREIALGHVD